MQINEMHSIGMHNNINVAPRKFAIKGGTLAITSKIAKTMLSESKKVIYVLIFLLNLMPKPSEAIRVFTGNPDLVQSSPAGK